MGEHAPISGGVKHQAEEALETMEAQQDGPLGEGAKLKTRVQFLRHPLGGRREPTSAAGCPLTPHKHHGTYVFMFTHTLNGIKITRVFLKFSKKKIRKRVQAKPCKSYSKCSGLGPTS